MRRRDKRGSEEKEVEELLRAAEDEMLLKFSVNSHTTHSNLDLELLRRFEALKSPSAPSGIKKESNSSVPPRRKQQREGEKKDADEFDRILGADLSTRFETLKGVGASSSSKSTEIPGRSTDGFNRDESENEEDEVTKVMKWAMDAARLDPSKSDDEDDEVDDDDDDDDDEDEDEDEDDRRRKPKK